MKKVLFKTTVILALMSLIVFSFIGCGSNNASPGTSAATVSAANTTAAITETQAKKEPVTLNFPTFQVGSNPTAPWFKKLVDSFNQKYDGQIILKVDEVPEDVAYTNKMKVLLASGTMPDITYGKNGLRDLAIKAGLATDLTAYMDADPAWQKSLGPIALAYNTIDGKLYSIADQISMVGYFYNKDLYNKAGISAPATTWDEFIADCDKLKAAGIDPLSFNTEETGWTTSLMLGSIIGTSGEAGNKFMNTMHPTDFEKPEVIDGINKIKLLLQKYGKNAVGCKFADAENYFLTGKTAMFCNGPWMISEFYDTTKSMPGLDKVLGCAAYPGIDGTGTFNAPGEGYMVTAKDKAHQDAAVEFVKWLTNDDAQQLGLDMMQVPPMSPNVKITDEFKAKSPILAELVDANANAKYHYLYFDSIDYPNVANEFTKLYDALGFNKITPEQMAKSLGEAAKKGN